MRAVIFAGPSLSSAHDTWPSIEVRPPAARGDILRAVDEGILLLGLVDGVFGDRLAVSPAELRAARARRASIFGAASLGALRAVEVPDAVEGVGAIFEAYRTGELADEDEVACTFVESTHRLVAYPLVTVRAAWRSVIGPSSALAPALDALKALPFDQRTRSAMRALLRERLPSDDVRACLAALDDASLDPKRNDALALVQRILREQSRGARAPSA